MDPFAIFLEFNLPNATTWFYFSFLLAMALFFKFSRLLSIRNWDVVTLFLLVPGFLLIQAAKQDSPADDAWLGFGYLWLLCGSGYFLIRCLIDLALEQRPALGPNLNFAGMAWLAGTLFVCLAAVAFRPLEKPSFPQATEEKDPTIPVGRESISLNLAQSQLSSIAFPESELAFWLKRIFAVLCHYAVVLGLIALGKWHFQDAVAGMAAATFYLLLPYTGMFVGQAHHVWPMVMVIWALVAYRIPLVSGMLLGLGAATAYFPALTLPIWIGFYWKRGVGRFLAAFCLIAALSLSATVFLLWMRDGSPTLARLVRDAMEYSDWQPWMEAKSSEGFWTNLHPAYRVPVFIAYMAFVVGTGFWPAPKNLAHVIALSAAVLIGIQFWFADQGGVYVLWYLPLLLLLVFRPKLSDRMALPIAAETDWLVRWSRHLARWLGWTGKNLEPVLSQENKSPSPGSNGFL